MSRASRVAALASASVVATTAVAGPQSAVALQGPAPIEPPEAAAASAVPAPVVASMRLAAAERRGFGPAQLREDQNQRVVSSESGGISYEASDAGGEFRVAAQPLGASWDRFDIWIFEPPADGAAGRLLTVFANELVDGTVRRLAMPVDRQPAASYERLTPDGQKTTPPVAGDSQDQVLITFCELFAWRTYLSVDWAVAPGELSYCNYAADLQLRIWLSKDNSGAGAWVVKDYINQWTFGVYWYRNALYFCPGGNNLSYKYKSQVIGDAYWPNGHDAGVIQTPVVKLKCV